jgi:two-component system response regulator AtoC
VDFGQSIAYIGRTDGRYAEPDSGLSEDLIFGSSRGMRGIQDRLKTVARSNVPVLIQGESGTGKEVLARLIHASSFVHRGPFVKVSCPAIPAGLFESELFGYEKGAFTGANSNRLGRVTLANGGTLFLDEIGELDLALQAKLLQLLQDGKFCPIGAQQEKAVEVRVICATNRDLEAAVANGTFRQDLFYRINVVNLHIPPLRERQQDVPELVQYFTSLYNTEFNCSAKSLSRELLSLLQEYHWPGNIRQLENLIKRYVILGSEESISNDLLPKKHAEPAFVDYPVPDGTSVSLKKMTKSMVREFERQIIIRTLQAHSWNRVQTARALNISYRALLYKLKDSQLFSKQQSSEAS